MTADNADAEPRTIVELARMLQHGECSSISLVESCLGRIAERNPSLNAFITVLADAARDQARRADLDIAAGRYRGPLHGVPVSLKDLIDLHGTPTTAASRVRQGQVADHDAPVAARLREAGAVFVGKTNLHEFAFGTTNEDSAYGPVRHPLDPTRSPGGSSGGSAASVLANMAWASIATDTGGSIRIPAAACGVVGLKPGFGEIDSGGVVPLSTTLDHVGPICRAVADARVVYEVLLGRVPSVATVTDMRRVRLGVPREYFLSVLDSDVAAGFDQTCARLREAGATVDEVSIQHAGDTGPIYLHIVLAEAAAYHAKTLDSRPGDYTPNVRMRLEMGRYVLAEDYARSLRGREILRREVEAALRGRDGLLLPTLAVPATKLGAETVRIGAREESVRNIMLRLTQLFNVTGHPAITLPCAVTPEGLPIGAQVVGHRGGTLELLDVAGAIERIINAQCPMLNAQWQT